MDGAESFLGYALLGCLVTAFLVELALNRRPFVVGIAIPFVLYGIFMLGAAIAFGGVDSDSAFIFFMIFVVAGEIGSVVGSGMARGLRLWIEFRSEQAE